MPSSTVSDRPAGSRDGAGVLGRPVGDALDDRILEAAGRCVARWGLAKTTVDDVAREAGCGRASIYRKFPGGRDELFASLLQREERRFFDSVSARLDRADTLEELVVAAVVEATRFLRGHEGLQYVLAHEPEQVLPFVAFDRIQPLLDRATLLAGPHLLRYVTLDDVAPVAEWITRLVLSYALQPSPHVDLADETDARRFVAAYLRPGLGARADDLTADLPSDPSR